MPRRIYPLIAGFCVAIAAIVFCQPVLADDANPAPSADAAQAAAPDAAAQPDKPPLTAAELEQLLAPIALYPDSLLTQMLMASTYPLEIVEADRWAKANKDLKGDALATELEKQTWDPSVKSMVNFPDQLATMSDQLDTTIKIGNAFIEQQNDVMNTVQVLRNKAQSSGNLKTNDQLNVSAAPNPAAQTSAAAPNASNSTVVNVQPAPAAAPAQVQVVQAPPQVITIESSNPQVVYVPTYSPTVVYGAWPYPPPPPYYPPRPPGYIATAAISFGVGVACGAAWGYAWGHSDWGHHDVNINVNQNVNFNNHINRNNYQVNNIQRNNIQNNNIRNNNVQRNNVSGNSWKHDPSHRQGVPYRDNKTAQEFGTAGTNKQAAQARQEFRGRTDSGQTSFSGNSANRDKANQTLQNRGADANRSGAGAPNRDTGNPANRDANRAGDNNRASNNAAAQNARSTADKGQAGAAKDRAAGNPADRAGSNDRGAGNSAAKRDGSASKSSSAFSDIDRSGSAAKADSQRGAASRGASKSGGGGSRGGGAARGGGGRHR